MTDDHPPALIASYRVQLRRGMDFAGVQALVPYLAKLGISHLYLSPPFAARAGSTHGYDVVDPNTLDPTLGGMPGFEALSAELKRSGLGLILDIVPNHMGIGKDNPWWWDVLQNGRASDHAKWFDINFDHDPDGKLVLATLGSSADEAIESGALTLATNAEGVPEFAYGEERFPLAPETREGIDAAGIDQDGLKRLLDAQHYRLVLWREGPQKRNYRRFFDVDTLAGLRAELPDVFEESHRLIFQLVGAGMAQGLRVDHVDGLADPGGYLERLQRRLREVSGSDKPFPVWVEKILVGSERLPREWPIAGTTGYEFANIVLRLLVDDQGIDRLEELRREFTGRQEGYEQVACDAKRLILDILFSGELAGLAERAAALVDADEADLKAALAGLLVHFPVYRTYLPTKGHDAPDRVIISQAVADAYRELEPGPAAALLKLNVFLEGELDEAQLIAVRKFEQLSGPVMAKSIEDTAFYRFVKLLALNEVGGDPSDAGITPARFHEICRKRGAAWPDAMLGTATHDTKRGEDTRVRLAVLTEIPEIWAERVRHWRELNAPVRPEEVHPEDEYIIYQTLTGVWTPDLTSGNAIALDSLRARLLRWLRKQLREAKARSSWLDPDEAYEAKASQFLSALIDPVQSTPFLDDIAEFVARTGLAGAVNGLTQAVLKLTAPGVPDIYQGNERWDFDLVDPDNRRSVDWDVRQDLLEFPAEPANLLQSWGNGAIKQHVIHRALKLRRERPALFTEGAYIPLEVEGELARHVTAFARICGSNVAIVAATLNAAGLVGELPLVTPERWGDTAVLLPPALRGLALEDVLIDAGIEPGPTLPLAALLGTLPVAILSASTEG